MSTPHIKAQKGDFASTVLMPGDPLRAKYIAKNFLNEAKLVNEVRGMFAFTGIYQGKKISVMGHGMGIASCSIYTYELFKFFDVENIIRIGSCGSLNQDLNLRDIVIALGASTDSKVNRTRFADNDFSAIASYKLLEKAVSFVKDLNKKYAVGNVFSADLFYNPKKDYIENLIKMNILAVEMELAGIYGIAAELKKQALGILTVSDHIIKQQETSPEERENTFNDMVDLALNVANSLE